MIPHTRASGTPRSGYSATWITRIATSWLIYRLTGSALLLGVVGFCGQIPTLLLSPFTGVLVDRMDRHRILLVTQFLSLLQSAARAVLTLAGRITVTDVLVLQVMQGIINAFDTPARQAFVVQMVEDRAHLPNAIALNSTMVNASRILGPLPARDTRMREELRTGFEYVWRFLPVRWALLLLSLVSIMGMPYTALYLASRRTMIGLGRGMAYASALFGVGLIAFAVSHVLWLSLAVLPIVGAGMMITMASANTIIQTVVTEELRGRVMAFYTMAFLGTAPIGSLLAGVTADRIGAERTILLGGVACLGAALWFGLRLPRFRELVRPIYVERGIIVATETEGERTSL